VWVKSLAAFIVGALYAALVVAIPIVLSVMVLETFDLKSGFPFIARIAPYVASCSPGMAFVIVTPGIPGPPFPDTLTTKLFYVSHVVLFLGLLWLYRRSVPPVRKLYLN
jgi:hypothetical protein